jgi:hypothetical protein
MADKRIDANSIKSELEHLIEKARLIAPKLAERLNELTNWIKKKSPGELRNKKYVCDFLTEIIVDTDLWLKLQSATQEDRQEVLKIMSASERFWYEDLFPRWINEPDPKLNIWKSKLMDKNFNRADEEFLGRLEYEIEKYGGATWRNYILDLSMATDILVSGSLDQPLCTQLTTLSSQYTEDKVRQWELTLCHWAIKRGLFVSYNPMGYYGNYSNLGLFILQKGDELPPDCYSIENL